MKTFGAILLFAGLAAAQPLDFYVKDKQYRFQANDAACKNDSNQCAFQESRGPDHHDYSINFIEVSDAGKLFDDTQLSNTLDQLDNARFGGNQQPIVFIYIHGWHNNAQYIKPSAKSNCSDQLYRGDVAKFMNCGLAKLAGEYPTAPGAPPRVVGIYLAWHGNDFNWPVLNVVPSYPIRRGFARTVGQMAMASALHDILHRIGEHRNDYFVLTMGHSFGSRVLENAAEFIAKAQSTPSSASTQQPPVKTGFMRQYRAQVEASATQAETPKPRPPVDLVFHVNAASSHSVSLNTIKEWKHTCSQPTPPSECTQNPLYLAISSRADLLTAVIMPIANIVFFSPLTDQYHVISAANTPWIHTNKIPRKVDSCPSLSPGSFCFEIKGIDVASEHPVTYFVDAEKDKLPAVFWAMNSDHWIAVPEAILHKIPFLRRMVNHHWLISSHGDVWNPGVFSLVRGVIAQEMERKAF
jgi:hypothetical protein